MLGVEWCGDVGMGRADSQVCRGRRSQAVVVVRLSRVCCWCTCICLLTGHATQLGMSTHLPLQPAPRLITPKPHATSCRVNPHADSLLASLVAELQNKAGGVSLLERKMVVLENQNYELPADGETPAAAHGRVCSFPVSHQATTLTP